MSDRVHDSAVIQVSRERIKQVRKGFNPEHDLNEHIKGDLVKGAFTYLFTERSYETIIPLDISFDKLGEKLDKLFQEKTEDYKRRLIIAAAMLLAEHDRITIEERICPICKQTMTYFSNRNILICTNEEDASEYTYTLPK